MKLTLTLVLASLAIGAPAATEGQDDQARADMLIFEDSLQEFLKVRNSKDRGDFDWSSDSCSNSPDNPFGFPFAAACQRHDFAYRNYKAEGRFTAENRKKIDDNFHKDLENQCSTSSPEAVCDALANLYYWAVRAFGSEGQTKRAANETAPAVDVDAKAEYEKAKVAYEEAVRNAQANGDLPVLDH